MLLEEKVSMEIQNVVASAVLGQDIDLNSVVRAFPGVEYRPETFPGLIYRLKKPRATVLIFRSGKMVCIGTKSERQAKRAVANIVDELKRSGVVILGEPEIQIQNIVATTDLMGSIDLEKAVYGLERSVYDPEQFPGLIHRMDDPKVVCLIFASGRVVCAGAKKEEEVHRAIGKLHYMLEKEELIEFGTPTINSDDIQRSLTRLRSEDHTKGYDRNVVFPRPIINVAKAER